MKDNVSAFCCEIIWVSNMQAGPLGIKGRDYNENTFHRTGKSSV